MRIDQTHRKWFLGSLLLLSAAVAAYIPYSRSDPRGATGGSLMGLIYGTVGSAFMLFAGLLGARNRVPTWRLGRATNWMRGHLWLGGLAFPLILLHGGFHFGGGLTRTLMWLFIVIFLSGIFGATVQHFMPRFTTERLPMETIYEQIGRVRNKLLAESGGLMDEASNALSGNLRTISPEKLSVASSAGTMGGLTVASGLEVNEEARAELVQFYENEMRPYLQQYGAAKSNLGDPSRAKGIFQQLRLVVPPGLHSTLDDLESIVEEKRQLDRQSLYHRLLHGWLLVHIPASYALLLLGAIHAVIALRY